MKRPQIEVELRPTSKDYKKYGCISANPKAKKKRFSLFFNSGDEVYQYLMQLEHPFTVKPRHIRRKKTHPRIRKILMIEIEDGPVVDKSLGFSDIFRDFKGFA